jgi:hypothetical protein
MKNLEAALLEALHTGNWEYYYKILKHLNYERKH